MIVTSNQLLEQLKNYGNPYGKIARMVKEKKLFSLTKGLYETNPETSGFHLSGSIYGPSYLSFNTALSYYGLIPESVYAYTNATTQKLKRKEYQNCFGTFTYRDVPLECFCFGINIIEQDGYSFMMATKEKALCDKLYDSPIVRGVQEMEKYLFEDMRIDKTEFSNLNREDIYYLAPKYHSTNLQVFVRLLRGKYHE